MRRAISFATFIAFLACVSLTSIAQDTPPQQHRAMPAPTNLQVLPKDIAPQDLMKMMFGFSQALGVQCNFCHEVNEQTHQPNFAADTKPEKASARTMIAMTQEINSKFMTQIKDADATPADKTVTCGTCHRGDHMPAPFVPKPAEHAGGYAKTAVALSVSNSTKKGGNHATQMSGLVFQQCVVDEPCRSHVGRDRNQRNARNIEHVFESGWINNGDVIHAHIRLLREDATRYFDQS